MRDQAGHEVEPADAPVFAHDLDLVTRRRIAAALPLFAALAYELAMVGMHQLPNLQLAQSVLIESRDLLGRLVGVNKVVALVDEDRRLGSLGKCAETALAFL